jgi:hypothetical protein
VVKAGLLFISRRIFHKILINIDHTCWTKNLAKLPLKPIDKIPSYVAPVNRKVTKDFIAKIPSYKDGKEKQALASQAYIDKIQVCKSC